MGFTQRQAGGKFTVEEADGFIAELEEQLEEPPPGAARTPEDEGAQSRPTARPARRSSTEIALEKFSDHDLATALQSRGWVVMEP